MVALSFAEIHAGGPDGASWRAASTRAFVLAVRSRARRGAGSNLARSGGVLDPICAAIRNHELLVFDYDGLHRVVAPYCHGATGDGDVIRAVQVGGETRSGSLGMGKLWFVDKMLNLRRTGELFTPDDPTYVPNDAAMTSIHCRVER